MTISSTSNRISYAGNSATTLFNFPYSLQMSADLVVLLVDSLGNQTSQALTTNYTISGTTDAQGFFPSGVGVTFLVAPPTGTNVVIYRDPPRTQLVQHVDNGGITAASLDNPSDKATMILQRHDDLIGRSLRQPDGDTVNFTAVPPAVVRANGGLGSFAGYDSTGQPTTFVPGPAQSAVSVAMSPVVQSSTLALARVALGYPSAAGTLAGESIGQGVEDDGAGNLRVKLDTAAAGAGVGASGLSRSANGVRVDPSFLRGFLNGFETSAPGANNVLTFGPGACVDSTNAFLIKSTTAAFTKTLASFATGTGNGGLDTGASLGAINTPYFGHVIFNPTTGAVDFLLSLSATAPTLPSGFTVFRCLTWGKTDSSKNFLQFQQRGDDFTYGVVVSDINTTTLGTGASLFTMTVPLGFQVEVKTRASAISSAQGGVILTSPDETDQAVSFSTGTASIVYNVSSATGGAEYRTRSNTAGQIRARSSLASTTLQVGTYGFVWTRGRNI